MIISSWQSRLSRILWISKWKGWSALLELFGVLQQIGLKATDSLSPYVVVEMSIIGQGVRDERIVRMVDAFMGAVPWSL